MKFRIGLAAAIASTFAAVPLATVSHAQTSTATGPALVELDDGVTVAALGMSVDRIDDMDVHFDGRKVGEVEEVLGTAPGTATALTVDFDDNAGFGDRDDVIVPLDRFRLDNGRLVLSADAAAVAQMPVWND